MVVGESPAPREGIGARALDVLGPYAADPFRLGHVMYRLGAQLEQGPLPDDLVLLDTFGHPDVAGSLSSATAFTDFRRAADLIMYAASRAASADAGAAVARLHRAASPAAREALYHAVQESVFELPRGDVLPYLTAYSGPATFRALRAHPDPPDADTVVFSLDAIAFRTHSQAAVGAAADLAAGMVDGRLKAAMDDLLICAELPPEEAVDAIVARVHRH